jgi:hypothetical protein
MLGDENPDPLKVCHAHYTYEIHVFLGSTGKTIFKATQARIKSFSKVDNPLLNDTVFPIITLEIIVEQNERIIIAKNNKDIIVSLQFTRQIHKWDVLKQTFGLDKEEAVYDLKFQALVEDSEPAIHTERKENDAITETRQGNLMTTTENLVEQFSVITMRLSVIEHRNRFKKALNFIAGKPGGGEEVTALMAIAYGITQIISGTQEVILQKPDNDTKYMQIIVPPFNLKEFCYFMQTVYGLYEKGIIVYQDLKYFYVIPRWSTSYAVAQGEYNEVHIYISDASFGFKVNTTGYYKDPLKKRYVISTAGKNTYQIVNTAEFTKETSGNKFKIGSYNSGVASVKREGEQWSQDSPPLGDFEAAIEGTTTRADDKYRYFYNDLNHDGLVTSHTFTVANQSVGVQLVVPYVDFTVLTFNRAYILIFKDNTDVEKKYGGKYRLAHIAQALSGEENAPLKNIANLMLLKVPE